MNGSFIDKIPALLLLVSALFSVVFSELGLPVYAAITISVLLLAAEILLAEDTWDAERLIFAFLLSCLTIIVSLNLITRLKREDPLPTSLSGIFLVTERRSWGDSYVLQMHDKGGNSWMTYAEDELAGARSGESYSFSADVVRFKEESARSSFSPLRYWRARGVRGELRGLNDVRRLKSKFSLALLGQRIRQKIRERLSVLPPNTRALMGAVLLGDRDPNLNEDFRRWGISHILAVSGWHVGLAIVVSSLFFGSGRKSLLSHSLFLWGYCFISGCSISAVRAALMLQVALIGFYFGFKARALNSVGIAATLMLLYQPWVVFDIAWQLSVLATIAVTAMQGIHSYLAALLSGPIMWAVSSPLISPIAGGIYYSSLPINILAGSVFTLILCVAFLGSLPTLIGFNLAFFALPSEVLMKLWAFVADWWVDFLPGALPAASFPLWFCGGLICFLIARTAGLNWRQSFAQASLACAAAWAIVWLQK